MLRDRPVCWVLERSTAVNCFPLSKHVNPLYNEFQLHRTLVKSLRADPVYLIRESRSLLTCLLVLCDIDFPRSEIIQNLSVLISSIECIVRITNGNYGIG